MVYRPLVSIVIPLFNRKMFIEETLASVQAQVYPYWETIVVDDGSTDGSFELVEQRALKEQRIKLYKRDSLPKGAPTCRNIGAEKAQGKYLVFLDSDDLLVPFCLERRVAAFEENEGCDFIVFSMLLFHEEPYDLNVLWNIDTKEDDLVRFLRGDAVWQTTCPIYNTTYFLETGRFDESLVFWQDYELHVRLLVSGAKYKKVMDAPPDCFNRRHESASISHGGTSSVKKLAVKEKVFAKILEELKENKKLTPKNRQQVCAMFFSFSYDWISYHADASHGFETWNSCYEEQILKTREYILGYVCLALKDISQRAKRYGALINILHKLLKLFLPSSYWKRKTFLSRIKYSSNHA